jgi:hypothetical protein
VLGQQEATMKQTRDPRETNARELPDTALSATNGGRARPPARNEEPFEFENDPFANTQPRTREYREQQRIREAWEARQAPEVANNRNLQQQANDITFTFTPATPRLGPQR